MARGMPIYGKLRVLHLVCHPKYKQTPVITNTAWQQGWRVLEPLQIANYDHLGVYHEVINDTLSERCPSLVLMQTPPRIWKASCAGSKSLSADKQKKKEDS